MDRSDPAFHETYDRWYRLKEAKGKIDNLYSEVTKTEWEVALSEGIYVYEFVYGETENFFKSGNNKFKIRCVFCGEIEKLFEYYNKKMFRLC